MYRTVPLIDGLLTLLAIGSTRLVLRGVYHWGGMHQQVMGGKRVLVVGAGEAGTMAVREMRTNPHLEMEPVAFVDDDVNRLLRRDPIVIDQTEVADYLSGLTVLITGAGGSIGSELCRQIARCNPKEIILLGHGENSIFEISLDLRLTFPNLTIHQTITDVKDAPAVNRVVEEYRLDVIFP